MLFIFLFFVVNYDIDTGFLGARHLDFFVIYIVIIHMYKISKISIFLDSAYVYFTYYRSLDAMPELFCFLLD